MNDLINNYFCSLENIFRNDITEMKENLQTVMNIVKAQADAISRQTVVIKKIEKKLFPEIKDFDIFPIKTMDELENVDIKIKDIEEEELVIHILIENMSIFQIFFYM